MGVPGIREMDGDDRGSGRMSGSAAAEGARLKRPSWKDPRLLIGILLVLASVVGVISLVGAADQPYPRLIAGRLDAQHLGVDNHRSPFRMTPASTPDGW